MIGLFNKKDTFIVVWGMLFLHALCVGLCVFFVYQFIVVTYDSGVFALLFILIGGLTLIDVMCYRIQAVSRFLVRCSIDEKGIHCVCLGRKKWSIFWKDIRIAGIIGYATTGIGLIFLSIDKNEKYNKTTCIKISNKRIVFQAEERIWAKFSENMPGNMKLKLQRSMEEKRDCYYRF